MNFRQMSRNAKGIFAFGKIAALSSVFVIVAMAGGALAADKTESKSGAPKGTLACKEVGAYKDDDVVIKFKDEQITFGQFKKYWTIMTSNTVEKYTSLDDATKAFGARQFGLTRLLAKKARAVGLEKTDLYKAKYYEKLSRFMPAIYQEKVVQKNINPSRETILSHVPPALPEVQVRVLVKDDLAAAEAVYKRLLAGEDLEKLVQAESTGFSKERGGLSPWLNINKTHQYPSTLVQKFLDAKEGQIFAPFYQDVGYLLVRVEKKHSKKEVEDLWLEGNRDSIIAQLVKESMDKKVEELSKANADIKINGTLIDSLTKKSLEEIPNETLVDVRGMKFSLARLMDPQMKLSKHGDKEIYN
ncbi:hypothetical protein FDZ71_09510, partial [bacterium]